MDVSSFFSTSLTTWIVSFGSVFYILYRYGTWTFGYFKDQGIPGPKPLPYVGNMWGLWKVNLPEHDQSIVKKFGKTFGYFDGQTPNLWTTDIQLIRSIFIKDFDHFINRREVKVSMKVIRKMVSIMENQEWKDVRSSVTPAFTTKQIKRMSVLIKECADRLVLKFEKLAQVDGKIHTKQQFSAFTIDVIARCAFGMTINNLDEKDDPFMARALKVFNPPANKSPLILLPYMFPKLMGKFAEQFFFKGNFDFFISVMEDLVKQRASSSEKYDDFVQVATESILEYIKEGKQTWNKEEVDEIVIAQSVLFLLAGFDTTSTTLSNTIFLLTTNPEVQNKLYEEILKRNEEFDEVCHEMILDLPYLDHIITETLRMYPPLPRIERVCNKDVIYNEISIKKGTVVTVPTFALHYDQEYYPEPNRFNPDRWDSNSGIKPNPNTFMPFGMGPRNCIGMRFAMEEMKIALCTLVKHFRFFPVPETPEKLQLEDGFMTISQPIHAKVGIGSR